MLERLRHVRDLQTASVTITQRNTDVYYNAMLQKWCSGQIWGVSEFQLTLYHGTRPLAVWANWRLCHCHLLVAVQLSPGTPPINVSTWLCRSRP